VRTNSEPFSSVATAGGEELKDGQELTLRGREGGGVVEHTIGQNGRNSAKCDKEIRDGTFG